MHDGRLQVAMDSQKAHPLLRHGSVQGLLYPAKFT